MPSFVLTFVPTHAVLMAALVFPLASAKVRVATLRKRGRPTGTMKRRSVRINIDFVLLVTLLVTVVCHGWQDLSAAAVWHGVRNKNQPNNYTTACHGHTAVCAGAHMHSAETGRGSIRRRPQPEN